MAIAAVTPQIRVKAADKVIDFLKKAFDAKDTERLTMSDGSIFLITANKLSCIIKIVDSCELIFECTHGPINGQV
jgi:uncharacterized glyoxalase superfamily protein PhnB